MKLKPPTALNTDEQWAQAISWLQERSLQLIVPLKGEAFFVVKLKQKIDEPRQPEPAR